MDDHTPLSDLGATIEVIASRGETTLVVVPARIWRRLPTRMRRGLADVAAMRRGKEVTARLVPLDRFAPLRDAVEDAADIELAEGADADAARERDDRERHGVGPGIPAEVVRAEIGGTHPIAAWRKHRGKTQAELAAAIGINRGYLAQLERGGRAGTPETLGKVARALGCLVDDLLDDDGKSRD